MRGSFQEGGYKQINNHRPPNNKIIKELQFNCN